MIMVLKVDVVFTEIKQQQKNGTSDISSDPLNTNTNNN